MKGLHLTILGLFSKDILVFKRLDVAFFSSDYNLVLSGGECTDFCAAACFLGVDTGFPLRHSIRDRTNTDQASDRYWVIILYECKMIEYS